MPTVLVILAPGFEEIEAATPVDLLRRAGAQVTLAALNPPLAVTGRSQLTLTADALLAGVEHRDFDLLLLPGGPGVKALRADSRVRARVQRHHAGGAWIAAICAAPAVLHDAGLLAGRRYTAHFSVADELKETLGDQRVVVDGRLITSRGAGTALDFGLELVARLFSPALAREVAKAICA